jgi:putative hydrolase of the HAD superfamily
MTIRVITFDLDNTLWDVEPALLRAEEAQRQWLLEHRPGAVDDVDHDGLWELKKRLWRAHPELAHNVSAMRKLLLRNLQLAAGYGDDEAAAGAEEAFGAFLLERQRVELYSDALEVLQSLAGRYRLGALTNGNADVYKTDAGEYFDFAFLAEEVGASKPAPDMFHAALAKTGVRPEEVLHVGDNPEHDVRGALAVGMRTAWINAGNADWEGDDAPDIVLSHVRELPAKLVDRGWHRGS